MKEIERTEVQFRIFKGEVTAVFPYIIEGQNTVSCYVHNGQHSTCIWSFNKVSKAAKFSQYEDLYNELISLGYVLKVITNRSHKKYLAAYHKFYQ